MKRFFPMILTLVAAMLLLFPTSVPVIETPTNKGPKGWRLRVQPGRIVLAIRRFWHFKVWRPVHHFIKFESRMGAARALSFYSWATRQEGFEGYTLSKWRWFAVITLGFSERERRNAAIRNGAPYYIGAGGPVGLHTAGAMKGRWMPSPAGGAAITRVGDASPLFYNKVAGALPVIKDMTIFPGNIFYVDSDNTSLGGSTSGFGTHPDKPLLTVDNAIDLCTAAQADFIFVLPGHNESLAAANTFDADVQGISIIGRGRGDDKPRFDGDATAGSVTVGDSGVHLQNLRFLPSITVGTQGIAVEAAGTDHLLEDIEVVPGEAADGTDEFVDFITVAAGAHRGITKNLDHAIHASADGNQTCISLVGASDRLTILGGFMDVTGTAAVACIQGITTLSTRIHIEGCLLTTDAEPGIELLTGTTGLIKDVSIFANLATIDAATVADGCAHVNVTYTEVGDEAAAGVKTLSVDD